MAFGETLLEKLLVCDSHQTFSVPWRVEGSDEIRRLLDARQGALIITAHFGNPEICRHLANQVDRRVSLTILVHTRHAQRFNQFLKQLNPEQETDLIQVDRLNAIIAMRLAERIAAGGFVVIAGDRIPLSGQDTLATSFLGAAAPFPVGPYLLAAALGCPVLTMFSARIAQGFAVHIRPLADPVRLPRKARREAALPFLRQYVAALEAECLAHPLQWFNFFPFWANHAQPPFPATSAGKAENPACRS
jgi:predicted LPLAT superfamily acyltransferase